MNHGPYKKSYDLINQVFLKNWESVALHSTITRALAFLGIRNDKLLANKAILMPKIVFF